MITFFFFAALHLILSSYFDVVDIRLSNVVNSPYSASPSNFPWGTYLVVKTLIGDSHIAVVVRYFFAFNKSAAN